MPAAWFKRKCTNTTANCPHAQKCLVLKPQRRAAQAGTTFKIGLSSSSSFYTKRQWEAGMLTESVACRAERHGYSGHRPLFRPLLLLLLRYTYSPEEKRTTYEEMLLKQRACLPAAKPACCQACQLREGERLLEIYMLVKEMHAHKSEYNNVQM